VVNIVHQGQPILDDEVKIFLQNCWGSP
jgi:hypothetical protein